MSMFTLVAPFLVIVAAIYGYHQKKIPKKFASYQNYPYLCTA